METLSTLQDKVEKLIALVKNLKTENAKLKKENTQLTKKMETISSAVEDTESNIKELSQEKTQTKVVVEDLIKSIDSFIGAQ